MAEPDELSTTEAALSPCVLDAGVRAFEEFIAAADSEFVVRQIYAAMRAAEAERRKGIHTAVQQMGCDEYPPKVCVPPAEHRQKRWHWVYAIDFYDGRHTSIVVAWISGNWKRVGRQSPLPPDVAWRHGWRYLEPCIRTTGETDG